MGRSYGQFCGLARAAELVGERWTLLILRDLSVGPARFSELKSGLTGIAATMLTARLRDLEEAGLISKQETRVATTYELSESGRTVLPALAALSLWGASTMAAPRSGEVVTDRSLAAMLATTRTSARVSPFVVELRAPGAAAHAKVTRTGVEARPGRAENPGIIVSGQGLRALLADPSQADHLVAGGHLTTEGDSDLLTRFAAAFHAPFAAKTHA
ncbi:winged helix-turn-helix transcriptional regulator [Demetria terragena]|uniref:winged helix-turn-helix transcriptional regulator n=1 Tax=Demetria terragena TaxID=63959 RepID=UPI0003702495|nr:helix-turn-helix domain-containing protein [Demetria terragena]